MNNEDLFPAFVKRLKEALGATEGTGDEANSEWRAFLTLPGGERLFVRTGKKDKVDIHPMIGGKVQSDFISAGVGTLNLSATVGRIKERFSETGEWGKMVEIANRNDAKEKELKEKRDAAANRLESDGWTITARRVDSISAGRKVGDKELRAEIGYTGTITLKELEILPSQLAKICLALSSD